MTNSVVDVSEYTFIRFVHWISHRLACFLGRPKAIYKFYMYFGLRGFICLSSRPRDVYSCPVTRIFTVVLKYREHDNTDDMHK